MQVMTACQCQVPTCAYALLSLARCSNWLAQTPSTAAWQVKSVLLVCAAKVYSAEAQRSAGLTAAMACHPPVRQWVRTAPRPTAPQNLGQVDQLELRQLLLMVRLLITGFFN